MKVDYDSKYDILYVRDPCGGQSYGEEDENGIIIYRNINTDCIIGIAIKSIRDKLKKRNFGDYTVKELIKYCKERDCDDCLFFEKNGNCAVNHLNNFLLENDDDFGILSN